MPGGITTGATRAVEALEDGLAVQAFIRRELKAVLKLTDDAVAKCLAVDRNLGLAEDLLNHVPTFGDLVSKDSAALRARHLVSGGRDALQQALGLMQLRLKLVLFDRKVQAHEERTRALINRAASARSGSGKAEFSLNNLLPADQAAEPASELDEGIPVVDVPGVGAVRHLGLFHKFMGRFRRET